MTSDRPTILVVEDERDIADLFATWLDEEYGCRVAYDGETALDLVDEDVDAILLDRRMPGLSGDEVLEAIREHGLDCPVGMVTAVEPDLDIVEMGFDDYVVKPVGAEELHAFVDDLLSLSSYEREMRRFYQLASKRAALETAKKQPELEQSSAYQELLEELEDAKTAADANRDASTEDQLFSELC